LAIILASGLIVEAVWRSSGAYVSDLLLAAGASGAIRGTAGQIFDHLLGNFADLVMLALFAGMALWRTRSIRDALFYGFCALSGFLIVNQNFQVWGIITIHAAAAVAAQTLLRSARKEPAIPRERAWSVSAGASLLFLALVLPAIVHFTIALGLHAALAGMRAGEPLSLANLDRVRLVHLWTWSEHDLARSYLAAVQDGTAALSDVDPKPSRIAVLDFANPFSAVLRSDPASGDSSWLLWGRSIDAGHFLPPDRLLANNRIVMQRRLPIDKPVPALDETDNPGGRNLQALYSSYIAQHFDLVRETDHWRVHRRRAPPPADRVSLQGTAVFAQGASAEMDRQ
jgi:hypothetical protein